MFKKLLIICVILVTSILLYSYFKSDDEQQQHYQPEEVKVNQEEDVPELKTKQEVTFFEEVIVIDGQPMYYAYPSKIQQSPPKLIIYCHGQLQRITENLEDEYMLKMKEYGQFFASRGYVFSASNQHDDNWGGKESLKDIQNSIQWFEENLIISKNSYIIGFSMGGRTAVNYAIENPSNISAIALLAPTPRNNLQKTDVEALKSIPIKIWHGTEDINIPFSTTTEYVKTFNKHNKEMEVVPIENADHFEIETTLMQNILEFFEASL